MRQPKISDGEEAAHTGPARGRTQQLPAGISEVARRKRSSRSRRNRPPTTGTPVRDRRDSQAPGRARGYTPWLGEGRAERGWHFSP